MDSVLMFATIGALGVGAQWLAWRLRLPAIVLMLLAGLIAGPGLGWLNPAADFGELLRPIVAVAVAMILFEGGLTLDAKGLRDARPAVRRLVFLGAPFAWLFASLAARYAAGLSWESSIVFGGILIVTGPTVIAPLLRQAKLARRPAEVLRWESILNDPVGALAAVLAFEVITAFAHSESMFGAAQHLVLGIALATFAGYAGGWFIARAFRRGWVPEYMKVPVLLVSVIAVYASTDSVLHESGLLAVTVMGVFIANAHLPSVNELKRFKEHITVLLVSGVFILLAAGLNKEMIALLDWSSVLFVVIIVFVVRPGTVLLALIGTGLSWRERLVVGWLGPRGVVAVAVSGLFGARLAELGYADGAALAPLAFALVAATVVLHGFSAAPMARALGLTSAETPGVLLSGATEWSVALAKALAEQDIPVMMADRNWFHLRPAREAKIPIYFGEILSEAAEHTIDLTRFGTLVTASENDDHNTLICTDFAPEFGRSNVFQVGRHEIKSDMRAVPNTLGGRAIANGQPSDALRQKQLEGWRFSATELSDAYGLDAYLSSRPRADILAVIRKSGLLFLSPNQPIKAGAGDVMLAYLPKAQPDEARATAEAAPAT